MSDTFCSLPFTHLNIKQKGKLSACWRYPDKIGDYSTDTLTDTWNGEKLRELRRALLNGERPSGCRSCWDMEDAGIKSTRQQHVSDPLRTEEDVRKLIDDDYNMPISELSLIEVRFDNICNLECRHCSSDYSSKWDASVRRNLELKEKMIEHGTYREPDAPKNLNDRIIDEIGELSKNLNMILISGGEPIYHDKHFRFLENMLVNASRIELSYNSNLTTLEYKGKSVLDLWKQYKKITLRVSLDGYPPIYEYIRTHKEIGDVETNIKQINESLKNSYMSATCTTSVLNITRIPQIFEYFNSIGTYIHTSIVQYPQALNPRVLPLDLKERITQEWNTWLDNIEVNLSKNKHDKINLEKQISVAKRYGNTVIKYMNSKDQYSDWDKFIDYTKILDKHHNTNILEVYPEFIPYWK